MSERLNELAIGKLATRASVTREIQAAVHDQLYSQNAEKAGWGQLDGPLGEQIAIAAGSFSLREASPEHIAEGIGSWLDKYFLPSPPQEDGPREGPEDASPPPCIGGEDGSRVLALAFRKGAK